jgi:flagellar assembly factor FliW
VKVATKPYGLIEVDERQKIHFPKGLFGFEGIKDYLLLDADRQPFYWLQAQEVEQLAFILINPFLFRPDYELNIDDEELKAVGITGVDKALVFSIVTMLSGSPMTANLQGPLVINRDTRVGLQAILSDSRWKIKHDVMAELAAVRQS